jgi:ATP-dependent RNA/DNA helicase IGHMBP2
VYIDTAGCGVHELETDDVESKGNEGEADLVFHHIKKLRSSGVPDKDIAVIAPYSLQVELIRERIRTICSSTATDSLEVHTVDGFQGREKEAVIISLTRSNDRGEYGFLKEQRRSNVAVTRARRHLCLIGDSDTVSCEPFIKGMIETCHRVGEVWSAHEYMQDPDFEVFQCYQPKQNKNSEETKKQKKAVYNEDEITSHSGSGRSKPRPATQSIPTTLKAGSPTTITGDLQSKGDQRVTFEEAIHSFIDSDSAVLSFPSSLTGNERKIVHELCEQFGLLHVSKGYGKERFIEVQKYNIMAQAKSLPRDEAESLPTDSSEARELDPIAHEEVLGPKSEICDVCRKSILQENWELHQIQCLKRMEREKCTELKIRETNTTAHQPKHTSRKRSSQTSHGDPTHEDLDKLLAEVTLADSMCKFSQCSKKVNWLGIFCQFCKKRFCMEHRLPEVHGCGDSARQQSRKDLQREAKQGGKTSVFSGTKRSQIQAKLAKKLEEKSSARQTKTDTKSKGKR